jgi:hypothetical protein
MIEHTLKIKIKKSLCFLVEKWYDLSKNDSKCQWYDPWMIWQILSMKNESTNFAINFNRFSLLLATY